MVPFYTNQARIGYKCSLIEWDNEFVSEFPQFEYTMKQVEIAGKALAENLLWSEESGEETKETFRIANNWCPETHQLTRNEICADTGKAHQEIFRE